MPGQSRIVVIGKHGQLARCLGELADERGLPMTLFGRDEVDLADSKSIGALFERLDGDFSVLINAAAATDTKGIELDPTIAALSERVNQAAPGLLAEGAAAAGALFIHVSTDFVFGQGGTRPWRESDKCHPVNAYGRQKLAGESAVAATGARALILRTSYLFSEHGKNFVKSILQAAETREHIKVVDDIVCAPTAAMDLAQAILALADGPFAKELTGCEIFHYCSEGETSLHDFAKAIVELCNLGTQVEPVGCEDFADGVERPAYSALDTAKFSSRCPNLVHHWRPGLMRCLHRLGYPQEGL